MHEIQEKKLREFIHRMRALTTGRALISNGPKETVRLICELWYDENFDGIPPIKKQEVLLECLDLKGEVLEPQLYLAAV
nr:hypothetical protein [uncultured archaeon]